MAATARVLVFETEPDPAVGLCTRLRQQGYESLVAKSAEEAVNMAAYHAPDVALLDVGTGADGALLSQEIQRVGSRGKMPIIVIGESTSMMRDGSVAEFLPRPFHDAELFSRLEALSRMITMQEELQRRSETVRRYGLEGPAEVEPPGDIEDAAVLIIARNRAERESLQDGLAAGAVLAIAETGAEAIERLERNVFDAVVMNVGTTHDDAEEALAFCSGCRRNSRLYNVPILLVCEPASFESPEQPFACGATDVLLRPVLSDDLMIRAQAAVRQRRYRNAMQDVYRQARHFATSDSLTGLYSHGFLHAHLNAQIESAIRLSKTLSVGFFDVDEMADINQTHGFIAGDRVLRQIGGLLGNLVRGEDLPARYGGDEFCVVLPDTGFAEASVVLQRIAGVVNHTEFSVPDIPHPVPVQIKTGYAELQHGDDAESLIERARENPLE